MLCTIEAVVEEDGSLRLLEDVELHAGERVLVTILSEEDDSQELAMVSEKTLAVDWNRDEEEQAWQHLQQQ